MSNKKNSEFKIQRFGRYLLLDHLVDGGMAKICRARFLGEQANKIVAIKMIQEQYSKDEAFVQMFRDELKVTFGLIHPNIAQTYDYGEVEGVLYTAMEYVDGANLKQFLDRLKKRKFVFPVEISTYIISQVCQALYYAHTFTDKLTGKTYNIIHRDISPHNIMITYDGAVKVIDFGIAKAETNSEATQAGTIKGKLSYLAPEYLDGLELDHRYDQFAVGITLWEMLCSRKLFSAPNDLAVLKQIQACKVAPPSSINPNVPVELDDIVLKALSKDRNQRFKDMDALNRALVRFLYSKYPDFNATDLSFFAKELFKEDINTDRERLKEYGKIDILPYIQDFEKSYRGIGGADGVDASTVEALIVTKREGAVELEMDEDTKANFDFTRTTRRDDFNQKVSDENKKIQSALKDSQKRKGPPPERKNSYRERTRTINQDELKRQPTFIKYVIGAAIAGFALYLVKPEVFIGSNSSRRDIASQNSRANKDPRIPDQPVDIDEAAKEERVGTILFENYDPSMNIFINGEEKTFSVLGIKVPLNKKQRISITKKNFSTYRTTIQLTDDAKKFTLIIPELAYKSEGVLKSRRKYPDGTYFIYSQNNSRIKRKLPLPNGYRMPAGIYEGVIYNRTHGIKKRVIVKIEKDKIQYLD